MRAHTHSATVRVGDIEHEVEFSIESYGCPSNGWDEPGEAAEITLWFIDGKAVNSTFDVKFTGPIEEKIVDSVHNGVYDPSDSEY